MVFHEIDSITDVINGHRIIIYYIEDKLAATSSNGTKLFMVLEAVMEMLGKKNDDLLLIKVVYDSTQFSQFQELYKPEVTGPVTLFVINNEGIPIMCDHINKEENIPSVIESLTATCKLNCIPKIEISGFSYPESGSVSFETQNNTRGAIKRLKTTDSFFATVPTTVVTENTASSVVSTDSENQFVNSHQPLYTELQIRLPDGRRDKQAFNKDAMLQEVWVFISVKYKLKDFDLKTYNHQIFSEIEYEMSLVDLGLYPNGVIIVVSKNVLPFRNYTGIVGIMRYGIHQLMNKTTSLFGYMQRLLFMFWNSVFSANNGDDRRTRRPPQDGTSTPSSSKREPKKFSSGISGNIHTLRRDDDSDDENNRYNGNSTQQK